jgi:hypothetical protein
MFSLSPLSPTHMQMESERELHVKELNDARQESKVMRYRVEELEVR